MWRDSRQGWLILAFAVVGGCAVNPVTGERELALVSEPQEIAMGKEARQEVETSIGFVDAPALQTYVSGVGKALAARSERPDLPWEFHVVDDPEPNAFALPGGYIFVTRGLVDLMGSEAQLAAVLGHEIGHVTARHSVSQISRTQLAKLGLGIGIAVNPDLRQFGNLANTGLGLLFLKYGRDDERQADELGFRYMHDQGYDVREMADVFEALQASSKLAGQSSTPSWLATHPSEPDRIAAVQQRIAALDAPQQNPKVASAAYLEHLDGLAYGTNPRHGYFAGDTFYQPELGIEFKVPKDWMKQNSSAAVTAVSPERDAALELSLAKSAAGAAATAFLQQEGISELGSDRTTINGHTAVTSRFEADTEQGQIRGIVAHIAYGDVTYRLVTYAPAGSESAHDAQLMEIIQSFRPVADRSVLAKQPRRIETVKIDRDMTLEEFARRHPSTVPMEELAVLNQVEGASSRLRAGTIAKQVVG